MHNSQEVAMIIKDTAKNRKTTIGKMLSDCNLSKNTLSSMQSGGFLPRTETLAKIADYLDCSVDYLLGRVDTPDEIHLSSINNDEVEQIMTASKHESLLLIEFRNLNKQGKEYILQTLDLVKDKYKKSVSLSDMEDIG